MNINYPIVIACGIVVLLLIVFIIRKNIKDKKKFELENNKSEIEPEKHSGGEI